MTGGQAAESGKYSGDYGYEESRTYQRNARGSGNQSDFRGNGDPFRLSGQSPMYCSPAMTESSVLSFRCIYREFFSFCETA